MEEGAAAADGAQETGRHPIDGGVCDGFLVDSMFEQLNEEDSIVGKLAELNQGVCWWTGDKLGMVSAADYLVREKDFLLRFFFGG